MTDNIYAGGRHIFNLPEVVETYNEGEMEPTSRAEYSYDEGTLTDTPGVVGHALDFNPYAGGNKFNPITNRRGNVTQVRTYADAARRMGEITAHWRAGVQASRTGPHGIDEVVLGVALETPHRLVLTAWRT